LLKTARRRVKWILKVKQAMGLNQATDSLLWDPSHLGEVWVWPQSQMTMRHALSTSNFMGDLPVFWVSWEPSQ